VVTRPVEEGEAKSESTPSAKPVRITENKKGQFGFEL
jgi:hypothetical protein